MGYTLTFSAPPALQGFAAYYGGKQGAQQQSDNIQAQVDAQNDARTSQGIIQGVTNLANAGINAYALNQLSQPRYDQASGYMADGMGPPAPGAAIPSPINKDLLLAQYLLGGPQAASGYLANQEQFRNRMIAQNDAQSFQGEQRQLDRDFTTNEREARQEYRTNERIAGQDFYVNEQIPAQVAGRLGTTPAGVYDTGVQSVIAQGGDPATMSREQIMGIGMQTVQQQNQVRDLTNRQVFSGIQQQQGQIAQNTKPVYSPQQKQRVVQLQNAAANLQSDPKYFNSATGMPTPLGLSARQRIQAELNSIQPRMEYQEPPPNIGQRMGFYQDAQMQGPPAPGQGSPTQRQYAPGIKAVVGDSPFGARVYYEDGSWSDYAIKEGVPTPIRWGEASAAQSGGFTPGEPVVRNGREVGSRKENGGIEWTPEYVLKMDNPPEGPASRPKHFGFFEDEEKAGKFVLDAFEATTRIKVPQYDSEGNQLEPRSPSLEEVTSALSNVLSTVSDTSKMDVRQAENKYQDVIANNPYDAGTRADMAIQMIAGGQRKLSDFAEAHPAVQREIQSRLGGIIANAQNAATNQSQQPYERPFKKTKDGPTYIGLYDPATGKVTNERLLKQ